MDDNRVWDFEKSLWLGDAEHYRALIDDACLMVVPSEPYVLAGQDAVEAVADTPRWSEVEITVGRISRPDEGWIVVAYTAHASRPEREEYVAHCTSTYRRLAHDKWRVVQHQQTPPLRAGK
jgi:hypothetical protein